jgi:tetratricopeptide (TPR) repeat protein
MLIGSITSDLTSLTPLILGTMGFIALLLFKKQIQGAIDRAKEIEAQRKGVKVRASLSSEVEENSSDEETEAVATPPKSGSTEIDDPLPSEASPANSDGISDVRSEMMRLYSKGEEEQGDQVFEHLQAIESDPVELKLDRARRLAFRFMGGIEPNAIAELERLTEDGEIRSFTYRMIGICFEYTKQPSKAASAYKKSAESAGNPVAKANATVYRSRMLAESGDGDTAIRELTHLLDEATDQEVELALWDGLAAVFKATGKLEDRATALHHGALIAGSDASRWFQSGYAYSNADEDKFIVAVIHCYLTALALDTDHQWSKNNVGVALERLHLSIPSRRFYREASQSGNTLAMANLALIYLNQGFDEEAEALLNDAATKENPDDKVASVAADLAKRRTEQNQELAELKENGPRVSEFLVTYGRSRMLATPSLPAAGEIVGVGQADLKVEGSSVTVDWKLGSYLAQRRFRGEIVGAAVSGKFEKERFSTSSESTNWEEDGTGVGYIAGDGRKLRLLKLSPPNVTFLEVKISGALS